MNDYETAKAALAHAMKNPDAFSAEDINAFADIVEHGAPKYAAPNPMGEASSVSSLGPETSLESNMNAVRPPQPAPIPFQEQPRGEAGRAGPDSRTVDAYNAFGPARPGEPALPKEGDFEDTAHQQWFDSLHDKSLPSSSKMRDIYKPPSFVAKHPDIPSGGAGLDAIHQAGAFIKSASDTANAGHYFEPSLEQFRRDMYPVLGSHVMNMSEDSEQFKQYADMQWGKEFEAAKAENRTAIRHSFATEQNGTAAHGFYEGAHKGLALLGSTPVLGKAAARLMGGDEAVQNLENVQSQEPLTSLAGSFYGGSKLLAPLEGLIPGAASGAGRIAHSGAIGGATAAGATAADEALGSQPTSGSRIAKDAGMAGLLGLGAGTTFGAFGELPRAYRSKVIDSPDLKLAREGGAETSVLHGVAPKPGSEIERIQQEASGLGQDPNDLAVSRLRRPLSDAAAKEGEAAKFQHGQAVNEYEAQTANHRQAVSELFDVATKGRAEQVGPEGRTLAVGPEESNIRKIQNTVATVKPLREHYEVAKVLEPGEDGMLAQAKAMYGEDVEAKIARAKVKKAHLAEFADWGTNKPAVDVNGATEPSNGVNREAGTTPAGKVRATNSLHDTLEDPVTNLDTLTPDTPQGQEAWSDSVPDNGPTRTSKILAEMYGVKRLADAELMPAKTARANGIEVPAGVADDQQLLLKSSRKAPPGGKLMDGYEARAQGFDLPKEISDHEKVIVAPRKMNPAELKATIDSIDALQKTGKNVPKIDELQRAARQIRDRFPDMGPFKGATAQIQDLGTGQTKDLTGYSAAQHNYAEESSARELRNRRAGLLPEGKADEAQAFHNQASGYGLPGRAPEIDESLRSAASLADKSKELEFVKQMRAYSKLRGERLDPAVLGRAAMGRLPMQGRSAMNALNLHLDPILAGRWLPNAGALGGAAGYSGNRKLNHPDFDTINALLNPLGP